MSRKKNTPATTTVHERAGPSDADLLREYFRVALYTAFSIVYKRKLKQLKNKGRGRPTDRLLRQWVMSQKPYGMAAQVCTLVDDAIRRAKLDSPDADETPVLTCAILRHDLDMEHPRKRGRKPKQRGLIDSAMGVYDKNKRLSGRSPLIPLEKERAWLASVYGVKAKLLGNRRYPNATSHDIVEIYGNKLLKELDREVSDGEAAATDYVRAIAPGSSIEAIKTRIRRARKTFTLDLPKRKSGG